MWPQGSVASGAPLADDDHILVDVADERRRQAVQTAVGRRGLHPAVVHADFKQLTCAQNRVRAKGLAVAENAALDFEPPKRVRAQLKTPGNDASRPRGLRLPRW